MADRQRAAQQNAAGGVAVAAHQNAAAHPLLVADLSPTPRDLYVLWDKYQFGIGGRKPARLFTRTEKGAVKHKYHRRRVIGDLSLITL